MRRTIVSAVGFYGVFRLNDRVILTGVIEGTIDWLVEESVGIALFHVARVVGFRRMNCSEP